MKKVIELNGTTSGFAVYLYDKKDFIKGSMINNENEKDKKVFDPNVIKLFRSLDLLKSYMSSKMDIRNPYKYKLWIFIDDLEIDFDDVQETENGYEYFHNGIHYCIKETKNDQIIKIGYFTFSKKDDIEDKKQLRNLSKMYMNMIESSIYDIIKFPNCAPAIDSIIKDKSGCICISLKDSTVKVNICYNNKIMDLNMKRKEVGTRCIPYLKEMDKFRSIFVYMTKDGPDHNGYYYQYSEKIKDMILEYLEMNYSDYDPDFIEVEFKGNIFTN